MEQRLAWELEGERSRLDGAGICPVDWAVLSV